MSHRTNVSRLLLLSKKCEFKTFQCSSKRKSRRRISTQFQSTEGMKKRTDRPFEKFQLIVILMQYFI